MENNNNEKSALLVMDVQQPILKNLPNKESYIAVLKKAIEKARGYKIPVIYVILAFRKGYPEANPNGKTFNLLKEMNLDNEEGTRVHPDVSPLQNDFIVTKKRVSAFSGSDLQILLGSLGIKHLVLTGIATSGVVLSTLREAADKDYRITVLSDCCGNSDEEVQRVLLEKIFPRQAQVIKVDEWNNL